MPELKKPLGSLRGASAATGRGGAALSSSSASPSSAAAAGADVDAPRGFAVGRLLPLLPVVLALLGLLAALGYARTLPKAYSADSAVLVSVNPQSGGSAAGGDMQTLVSTQVQNFEYLTTTELVLEPAMKRAGISGPVSALADNVSATARLNTSVLEVHVTSAEPARAAGLANSVQESLIEAIAKSGPQTSQGKALLEGAPVARAVEPQVPSAPNMKMYALLGLILGAVAGLAVQRFLERRLPTDALGSPVRAARNSR